MLCPEAGGQCHRGTTCQGGGLCRGGIVHHGATFHRASTPNHFYHEGELVVSAVLIDIVKSGPTLLDLAPVAVYLGIGRSAILQIVDCCEFVCVHLPRQSQRQGELDRFLVDKADLDAVVERNKPTHWFSAKGGDL